MSLAYRIHENDVSV